jgi:hypothetical protein
MAFLYLYDRSRLTVCNFRLSMLISIFLTGYLYICGDAKHMAREIEATLESIIGKSMGGGQEEGAKELKLLKDRKRLMLDVWS